MSTTLEGQGLSDEEAEYMGKILAEWLAPWEARKNLAYSPAVDESKEDLPPLPVSRKGQFNGD